VIPLGWEGSMSSIADHAAPLNRLRKKGAKRAKVPSFSAACEARTLRASQVIGQALQASCTGAGSVLRWCRFGEAHHARL
jgi:hypothetical protein